MITFNLHMYTQLLTKIKNAQSLKKDVVRAACSKMDEQILQLLVAEKFIMGFEKKGKNPKRFFEIQLFTTHTKHGITGVEFVSTPSRRVYIPYARLRPIRQGYGISVVSTSKGIMTNKQARVQKVGGQILFNIW